MAFIVEPVASELVKGLFKILGSDEVRDFARQLVGGVDSDLEKLKKKLQMVEDLLRDAEDKQLTSERVKNWLDDLQHWAYDAEDLLDEFAYEALRRKLKAEHQASSSRGFSCLPACFPSPSFNVQMGSKIKEINSRLEQLCQQRSDESKLQELSGMTSSIVAAPQKPEETSSVPPERFVHGRNEDESKLLDMVKSGADIQVIAIVGMGGIGKTTIARVVYNHKELEAFKFERKAWVCVSETFDLLKISKELLEQFSSSVPNNLNQVQVKLKEAVSGKKFFLVLDDVWKVEYSEWEMLKSPFAVGAPGSTMIVTTRHIDVARTIRCSHAYQLKLLSDEACKSLFQEHAFGTGAAAVPNQISNSIYKRVVERCGGLPLAAKTLGGLLRSKPSDMWQEILNSKIWSNESDGILPTLKLSYHYLPANLKRCFAYSAIFPQDYQFNEKELAFLWMAEGIVQSSNKQLDEAGECFHKLCSRSLFQQSSSHNSKYIMHDLIHDLAQSVFEEIGFRSKKTIVGPPKNFKRIRHFSYISDIYNKENKFIVLEKVKNLRTFLSVFIEPDYEEFTSCHAISATVIFFLLPKLEKLRVLSFEGHNIFYLPNSIEKLIHLRYLNFSKSSIRSLPESTSQLFNLQTLLLKDCYHLMKLPSNMRYLTNLCYLDISGVNSLEEMPLGMKELKNLHILSNFIVGKDTGSNLEDLKNLSFLQGELHISNLENVTYPNKIEGQILGNKNNLKVLLLEWGYHEMQDNLDVEMNINNKLKPSSNLKDLTINGYGGESFPSWLRDSSLLSNLVVLKLENCWRCTSLPSLEMLNSLADLTIEKMSNLKKIDFRMPFKSLENLCFENLQELEYWSTGKGNEGIENFPNLRVLSIQDCPKLIGKLPNCLISLEKLVIRDCAKLEVSLSNYPKHCKLEIDGCVGMISNNGSIYFSSLNSKCLSNIPEVEIKLKQGFLKVEDLEIVDNNEDIIDSWQSLANDESSLCKGNDLSSLQRLLIKTCKIDVVFFGKTNFLSNLSSLEIIDCYNLTYIERDNLPLSLKKLEILSCNKLECLKDLSLPLLEYLRINMCDSLICTLLDGCKALTSIHIEYCSNLKSIGESFDNSSCLQNINLHGCANLESLPSGLPHLTCLESVEINYCPNLLVREGFPTSLILLSLEGDVKLDKPMIEWELHNLKYLTIGECEDAASILQEDKGVRLLTSLISLDIYTCLKLKHLSSLIFQCLVSLERLTIYNFPLLESIPHLTNLTSLKQLLFQHLPLLESIPHLTNLTSLTGFTIYQCPRLKSIPSLSSLISLTYFRIQTCERLELIPNLSSLNSPAILAIEDCPKLKSIPALRNPQHLNISKCPNLKSLQSLPSSLLSLEINDCPLLKKQWKRGNGKYSSKLAHIPSVIIDGKFIYNLKEEEE